jgi:xanthine dehydrogenase YagR molybdenum-binding subunit
MTLAVDVAGRSVTTVEGLAADPGCERLLTGLCQHDAAQCGFCIPGFVVSARTLLEENARPTPEEIREGLAGNLCRCGTYTKIFDGVLAASGQEVPRPVENAVALENAQPRVEIRQKVTGEAKYAADIRPEGMLWAKFIRFPHGAGRVVRANVDAARAVPGVMEVEMDDDAGNARYPGERVGHVVGESVDAVEDALEALALEVRRGDARTDPWEFHGGVPPLGAAGARGLAEAFEGAAVIAEAIYTTQVQTHSCFETHGGVVEHRGDHAEVWGSTQTCSGYRDGLTGPLGLAASNITVHCEHVGGGFGSKLSPGSAGTLAARMSKKFGRPCRAMLDRREEHLDAGNRPGSIQHMRVAAAADGRLLGARIHCASAVGFQRGGGGVRNPMVYDFGHVERTEEEISLSGGLPTPFRAPGHPQGCFAVQSMIPCSR